MCDSFSKLFPRLLQIFLNMNPFLMKIVPFESWDRELSNGTIFIKNGSILRKLWRNRINPINTIESSKTEENVTGTAFSTYSRENHIQRTTPLDAPCPKTFKSSFLGRFVGNRRSYLRKTCFRGVPVLPSVTTPSWSWENKHVFFECFITFLTCTTRERKLPAFMGDLQRL